jgi:hypothetical protein
MPESLQDTVLDLTIESFERGSSDEDHRVYVEVEPGLFLDMINYRVLNGALNLNFRRKGRYIHRLSLDNVDYITSTNIKISEL